MRSRRLFPYLIFIVAMCIFLISTVSTKAFSEVQCSEQMIPMRDGIRLHTYVYLPDPSVCGSGPYPAIVTRTPYGTGEGCPGNPFLIPGILWKGWGEVTAHCYAAVWQDDRGRFASEGTDIPFVYEDIDGYDTVEWVASQPWCDGNVGVAGSSAMSFSAMAAAASRPPHLKAVVSQSGGGNFYNWIMYEGQTIEFEANLIWMATNVAGLSSWHLNSLGLSSAEIQAAQNLNQSIIGDLMGHAADFTYADSAWWMHLPLLHYPAISVLQPFWNEWISHPTQDAFRDRIDFESKVKVPVMHVTTWEDTCATNVLKSFEAIQKRTGNQKLYVGDGPHMMVYAPGFWQGAGYDPGNDPYFQWFDYWLRGIPTSVMNEPLVKYYRPATEKWEYADQWPLPGVEYKTYYLHGTKELDIYPPPRGKPSITFQYDPRNPVPTIGGKNLAITAGSLDQRPVEPPNRNDVLMYTSGVLGADVEIAGNVKVVLHASSSCKDTDFTAKLIDVHPDGSTMLVLDGVIRGMYRESSRYPVLMKPGKKYEFTIDLGDISHVFKAGHRIQVDISSSNFPRRFRNTNSGNALYIADTEEDICVAENTIFHNPGLPSYIVLPVLPLKHDEHNGHHWDDEHHGHHGHHGD